MKNIVLIIFISVFAFSATAKVVTVGSKAQFNSIDKAIEQASRYDTILVQPGLYKNQKIIIDKPLSLIGEKMPVLDGGNKYQIITVNSDSVLIKGFKLQNSSFAILEDPAAIKIINGNKIIIESNYLLNNFFGIYLQKCKNTLVKNNRIIAKGQKEQESGNGIHCWKSDSLQIIGNKVERNRDGIYFEFVTNSVIWRNISEYNLRYGLHFMFSNNDAYFTNIFRNNGAGVSVMFTKKVVMMNNTFSDNWGDAAYGLLLKEISDCHLEGNTMYNNTAAVFMDGSNRMEVKRNIFKNNGWGLKMQANCMDNYISSNNFLGNTFDISTNGSLTLNSFSENYWDKYEGYDLNKDKIGDVPYHPLSIFAVIVEGNPPAMLLYRSFMITLLDKSEKILPSITPDNFVDNKPLMNAIPL
ncbi:MAG: nitrous oxide reductase family maturation protein NosD [Bacteroidia bacterium]|nr:nitrous oxide reductase family maturation protein NosD [Bacteroidia bacterium]